MNVRGSTRRVGEDPAAAATITTGTSTEGVYGKNNVRCRENLLRVVWLGNNDGKVPMKNDSTPTHQSHRPLIG